MSHTDQKMICQRVVKENLGFIIDGLSVGEGICEFLFWENANL